LSIRFFCLVKSTLGTRQPGKRGRPEPSLKGKVKKSTNETVRTNPVGTRQHGKRSKSDDLIVTVPIEARQPGKSAFVGVNLHIVSFSLTLYHLFFKKLSYKMWKIKKYNFILKVCV